MVGQELLSNQLNLKSFLGLSIFLINLMFLVPVYGSSSCSGYLGAPNLPDLYQPRSSSLLNDTINKFLKIQESLNKNQGDLIVQLKQLLKERSLSSKLRVSSQLIESVPVLSPSTIDFFREWPKTAQGGSDQYLLEDLISQDPYIKWLIKNWKDNRPNHLKANLGDFSAILRVDGLREPKPTLAPEDIFGYLNQHLRYVGPMSLSANLIVFRIMRDHDPKLTEEMITILDKIFYYNKILYIMQNQTISLANLDHGTHEEWSEFFNLKNVMVELRNIKAQIRLMLPKYSEINFYKLQKERKLPGSLSFEEYILVDYIKKGEDFSNGFFTNGSGDETVNNFLNTALQSERIQVLQIYERYKLIKAILHNVSLSMDEELLIGELEAHVDSLSYYFLY